MCAVLLLGTAARAGETPLACLVLEGMEDASPGGYWQVLRLAGGYYQLAEAQEKTALESVAASAEDLLEELAVGLLEANRIHLCWALLVADHAGSEDARIAGSTKHLLGLFFDVVARNNQLLSALERGLAEDATARLVSFEVEREKDRERLIERMLSYQESIGDEERDAGALSPAERQALLRVIDASIPPDQDYLARVAARIRAEIAESGAASRQPPCEIAADRLYTSTRSAAPLGGGRFSHVEFVARSWGGHASRFLEQAVVRRDGSYGFLNAEIRPLTCRGPRKHMVVFGQRWLFLVWRVNGLLARYWEPGGLYDFTPRSGDRKWPDAKTAQDFAAALGAYYGLGKPPELGTFDIQVLLAGADVLAAFSAMMAGEAAELFVLLHEASHLEAFRSTLPGRSVFENPIGRPEGAGATPAAWREELVADGAALVALWDTAATAEKGVPTRAGALALVAAEGVLQSLAFLDRVDATSGSGKRANPERSTHPPTSLRRENLKDVFERLAKERGSSEAQIREAIDAMTATGVAWQALADDTFANRGDVISELRALRP